ncbi:hypothetical protein [Thauera sp.]|uniref:hypothetical protein n=1 Tax=Thauera sp. TaxID=1905334 RepID=UPI002C418E44|nr:hypothetical protein [Thauera sp.]HRP26368.1 hypothetical protein [Thauera sp.]
MLERQYEIEHAQGKVGICPFCQQDTAELWYTPDRVDFLPYQVRCGSCGARGPRADCGWESAVPSWDMVGRIEGKVPGWRGPGASEARET